MSLSHQCKYAAPALCCLLRVWINGMLVKVESSTGEEDDETSFLINNHSHLSFGFCPSLLCLVRMGKEWAKWAKETRNSNPLWKRYVLEKSSLYSKTESRGNCRLARDGHLYLMAGLMYRKRT